MAAFLEFFAHFIHIVEYIHNNDRMEPSFHDTKLINNALMTCSSGIPEPDLLWRFASCGILTAFIEYVKIRQS